jgi:perosamine synthetase
VKAEAGGKGAPARRDHIPVNEPQFTDRDAELVLECVRTGWVSSLGEFVEEFERRWAGYCGRRFGIAVSSGTAALQVALAALDLQPGDEVILPTFTIISCALAVIYAGATPVLVDSDPGTWTLDPAAVARRLTPRTKAIMPVHIYGHPADVDPILELAGRHGLAVVEDAAEAHGAEYRSGAGGGVWQRCGSFGTISCFSFYANKLITTGEGGMLVTDDAAIAARARSLRNLCFQPPRRYAHEAMGYNFRLTNLQAALGLGQLERITGIVEKKRWIGAEYGRRLRHLRPAIQLPPEEPWAHSVYWMYGIVADGAAGRTAGDLARALGERGVETRPFFLGMHEQPVFRRRGWFRHESYPVAERLAAQGLCLPSGIALRPEQLAAACEALRDALI